MKFLRHLIPLAGWKAVYFENPARCDDPISIARFDGTFPGDFVQVYTRP